MITNETIFHVDELMFNSYVLLQTTSGGEELFTKLNCDNLNNFYLDLINLLTYLAIKWHVFLVEYWIVTFSFTGTPTFLRSMNPCNVTIQINFKLEVSVAKLALVHFRLAHLAMNRFHVILMTANACEWLHAKLATNNARGWTKVFKFRVSCFLSCFSPVVFEEIAVRLWWKNINKRKGLQMVVIIANHRVNVL